MDGLIAFGGCIPTVMGIMPVAKADPLLIGKQPDLVDVVERELFSVPKRLFLIQKCHPYTGNLNPETLGDSKTAFLHCGYVLRDHNALARQQV